jgi:hypothetical protein
MMGADTLGGRKPGLPPTMPADISKVSPEDVRGGVLHQKEARGYERLRRDFAQKVSAAQDAKNVLDQEEHQLRELRQLVLSGTPNVDPTRLAFQEREVAQAWAVLTEAERIRDAAELALHRASDKGTRAVQATGEQTVVHAAVARKRHGDEIGRAQKVLDKGTTAREASQERQHVIQMETTRRDAEAVIHHTMGKERLRSAQNVGNERTLGSEKVRDSRFDQNAQRIMGLKGSIDGINKQLQASNEARRKKQQRVKNEHELRKNDLLEQGLNPYEVYRREEIEQDKEKQRQDLKARNELRSEKLLEQLIEEDKMYKKKLKVEAQKRDDMDRHNKEMGNYTREKKVVAYIKKMTIGDVEVLDPTGAALRIDPSKVTVQRTHSFGLGRASMDEIKKVDRDVKSAKSLQKKRQKEDGITFGDSDDDFVVPTENKTQVRLDADGEPLPEGKIWVPKLTILEQKYLAAARERCAAALEQGTVQRCWGKEFQGAAFLAKPSVIAFDDFEVFKRYRQVVEVTNVSFTFNQFKLLPLDDRVKEFFEVDFVPPGRMSAGVTRYITIWFYPKVSKDIDTTFPILAKTGRIDFPVRCTTKKTILKILPQDTDACPMIDFESVLDGEVGRKVLTVANSGALAAPFKLEAVGMIAGPDGELVDANTADVSDFMSMVTWDCDTEEFGAHATTKIKFTFTPTKIGHFEATLRLSVNNHAQGDAEYVKDWAIRVKGSCTDVPIKVEKEVYDLKTCMFDHIFRENIVLQNRRASAMKIMVEKPKKIEGELQMTPNMGFIQGNSEFVIQVKFSPKEDFLDRHHEFRDKTAEDGSGRFQIPVKIVGVDQVLPVLTTLVGTMCTNRISFEPKSLNFGRCFVGSSVLGRLAVINESLLPQEIAFTRLPSFLKVSYVSQEVLDEEEVDSCDSGTAVLDGGAPAQFAMLLPKQRLELCVTYTPDAAMELNYKLSLQAITGALCVRDYTIDCKGQGVPPIFHLSHTQVNMASIPCDVTSTDSIVITNISKAPYMMNLLMPPAELGCLSASPLCCVLQPEEQKRVQIEFKPTRAYRELLRLPKKDPGADAADSPADDDGGADQAADEAAQHKKLQLRAIRQAGGRRWETSDGRTVVTSSADGASSGAAEGVDADCNAVAEADDVQAAAAAPGIDQGTVHAAWRLAICMRPHGGTQTASEQKRKEPIYLGVRTCMLATKLRAEPSEVNFGEVTAGQRKIIPIEIQNLFPEELQEFRVEALPENACFTVMNAPRTIGAEPFKLLVEFKPDRAPQIYHTLLKIFSQNTRLQIDLSGRGVRPILQIEPSDGILHLGSVVYTKEGNDFSQAKLTVVNDSRYELAYNLETVLGAEPCHLGPSPFTMVPSSGVVEANGRKEVTVTFRPHRPLEVFKEKILVNVPNQKSPTYVYLYGHCFDYQAYCIPAMNFGPFNKEALVKTSAFVDALAIGSGSGAAPDKEFVYPKAQRSHISVVFESDERSKYVLLGAAKKDGAPAISVDFTIIQSDFSHLFTVEAPEGGKADKIVQKVPLVGGNPAIKAVFRYNPPDDNSLKFGDVSLDMLSGIGQTISCTVRCVITGGYVPPGTPANSPQEITIELRAYLQQI